MRCLSLTRFVLSLAAALLAVGVCAPRAQASFILNKPSALGLDNGLVGWWTFDGRDMAGNYAFDKSGNGNRGTLTGTNGVPVRTLGKLGQGLSFDGVDDSVDIPPTPAFVDNTTGSVSLWFNTKSFTAEQIFADVLFVSDPDEFRIEYLGDSNDQLRVVVVNNAVATAALDTANNTITDSNWHHLVVTSDGSVVRLFLDGAQKTLTAAVGSNTGQWFASAVDANRLNLGSQNGASSLLGSLDDVRIYNRALSADEIKRLYKIGATVKLNTTANSLTNGLVGWWTFDGKDMSGVQAYDRSGNGNRGILTSGPVRVSGKIGQALSFDGVNDYVDAGTGSALTNLRTFTLSAWVKPRTVGTSGGRIIDKHNGDGSGGWVFYITSNKLGFFTVDGIDNAEWQSAANSISYNTWQHVVVTFQNGGTPIFYVNGIVSAVTNNDMGTQLLGDDSSLSVKIGDAPIDNTTAFNGLIDDVRIYSRALSADEIKRLYNMGGTVKLNTTSTSLTNGLVGWWTFDGKDMAGNRAFDKSGQGHDGNMGNGPTRAVGKLGQGLNFDGVNDYIDTGNNFLGTTPLTISAWVYTRAVDVNPLDGANNKGKIIGNSRVILYAEKHVDNCNTTCFLFTSDGASNEAKSAADSLTYNKWQHVVVTRNSAGTANFYIDGAPSGSSNQASGSPTNSGTNNVFIGNDDPAARNTPWDGLMDDVRVYNRILSTDEIKRLYNMGR